VNAVPYLNLIAQALKKSRLEAVLIGSAAAALHGAPVTTLDFDFMFRKTAVNVRKLKAVAKALEATILTPFYPASDLYRLMNDETGLQVDFMAHVDGIRSFAGLRSRATAVAFGGAGILVACLDDIIRSKKAAGRPRDKAVMEVLEKTRREQAAVRS
jgi:hypothetical protein